MGDRYRDALSRAPLAYDINAEVAGALWYPSVSTTAQGAYLSTPPGLGANEGKPQLTDWRDGVFETTTTGGVRALVPCGPGTDNDLAAGVWYEWVKIDDPVTGAQPVECVGRVIVQ